MSLPQFKLLRARAMGDALEFLAKYALPDSPGPLSPHGPEHVAIRVVAGGTDLIPSMRQKLFEPEFVLDLRHVGELRGFGHLPEGGVEIGALTTLREIERS